MTTQPLSPEETECLCILFRVADSRKGRGKWRFATSEMAAFKPETVRNLIQSGYLAASHVKGVDSCRFTLKAKEFFRYKKPDTPGENGRPAAPFNPPHVENAAENKKATAAKAEATPAKATATAEAPETAIAEAAPAQAPETFAETVPTPKTVRPEKTPGKKRTSHRDVSSVHADIRSPEIFSIPRYKPKQAKIALNANASAYLKIDHVIKCTNGSYINVMTISDRYLVWESHPKKGRMIEIELMMTPDPLPDKTPGKTPAELLAQARVAEKGYKIEENHVTPKGTNAKARLRTTPERTDKPAVAPVEAALVQAAPVQTVQVAARKRAVTPESLMAEYDIYSMTPGSLTMSLKTTGIRILVDYCIQIDRLFYHGILSRHGILVFGMREAGTLLFVNLLPAGNHPSDTFRSFVEEKEPDWDIPEIVPRG